MGAITPIGNDSETFWANLLAGVPGGGPITSFDTTGHDVRIAAEVKDFDPTVAMDRKMARRMSRFIHFGVAAATEAVARSGIDFSTWTPEQRDRVGVVINTGGGGMEQVIDGARTLWEKGPGQVSPFAIPAVSGSMAAAQVSMKYGLTGPVMTQVAACASGVIAFQDALRLIANDECDVVIAGGVEHMGRHPMGEGADPNPRFLSEKLIDMSALSMGDTAHAQERGATILAEIIGAALTADAFHISAPEPTGRGAAMAMAGAMRHAGIGPTDIDYLVAHGTSTPLNDVTETKAIKRAYGERAATLAISSPKSMVGHMLGAAGAVAGIAAVGSIRDGWIPPTINYHEPDPECDLDYTPNVKRRLRVDTAMINGFGFGGQNDVAIFRRFAG